jgi:cobalt-zinc-cadmium resistance protein CzcA
VILAKRNGAISTAEIGGADNMEEAVSGVNGQLATKIYGDYVEVLETKGVEVVDVVRQVRGIEDLGLVHVRGQPNLDFTVDHKQAARYQINVADVPDRDTRDDRRYSPSVAIEGARFARTVLQNRNRDDASEIYREGNSRHVAIQYSVRGRDLGARSRRRLRRWMRK